MVKRQKILERVTPDRAGGKVEKSAGELNLDTWEFLRGTEEAYRCAARLFAPLPPLLPASISPISRGNNGGSDRGDRGDRGDRCNGTNRSDRSGGIDKRDRCSGSDRIDSSGGIDRGSGTDGSGRTNRSGGTNESGGIDRSDGIDRNGRSGGTNQTGATNRNGGTDRSGGIDVERNRQHLAGLSHEPASAAGTGDHSTTPLGKPNEPAIPTAVAHASTDFLDFDIASPQMSMFLNDVLESYKTQGLVPRLSVSTVTARLCNVGVRLGGISKNTNFLGLASADELKYHLTMGMLGPEGTVINELEGRAPKRVIAEVELTCEEEFVLENEAGEVLHRAEARGPKQTTPIIVHFVTFQSNIGEGTTLEWQITNINDVIKPTFAYYFARFGH
eukprot:jgi/Undpi1/7957/HiC_scaffold_24.g10429.m1